MFFYLASSITDENIVTKKITRQNTLSKLVFERKKRTFLTDKR